MMMVTFRVDEDRQFMGPVIAGAAAGAVASLTRVPTEVIKQRLQTGEFKGAIVAVSDWCLYDQYNVARKTS